MGERFEITGEQYAEVESRMLGNKSKNWSVVYIEGRGFCEAVAGDGATYAVFETLAGDPVA
jgi:hypothetical protein